MPAHEHASHIQYSSQIQDDKVDSEGIQRRLLEPIICFGILMSNYTSIVSIRDTYIVCLILISVNEIKQLCSWWNEQTR